MLERVGVRTGQEMEKEGASKGTRLLERGGQVRTWKEMEPVEGRPLARGSEVGIGKDTKRK